MVVRIDIAILYWFIGVNAAFYIFREAYPILNYLYIAALLILAIRSVIETFYSRSSYAVFPLRTLALFAAIISSLFYGNQFFVDNLIGSMSVILICLTGLKVPTESELGAFIKGYKLSIGIDFAYAVVQAMLHVVGVEINQFLFGFLAIEELGDLNFDISRFGVSTATRVTGLIWDPYVIGMFCVTAFFLFDKKWIKALSIVLLVLSESRAGLVAAAMALIYYYWPKIKERKTFIAAVFAALLAVIVLPNVVDLTRGFNRNSVGWRRIEYITLLPQVFNSSHNIALTLFGGAPAYSGARFYFSQIPSMVNDTIRISNWTIESDWLSVLYGQGLLGITAYILLFRFILKNQPSRIYKAIAVAILFGGIGYYYYTAIWANMLLILPCCYIANQNLSDGDKYGDNG